MRKTVSKILKIVLYTILVLAVLTGILSVLVNWSPFQQVVLKRGLKLVSDELGTEVVAGQLNWTYPNEIELIDFELKDRTGDSMIYVGHLKTTIENWSTDKQEFYFGKTEVENAKVLFNSEDGPGGFNYLFLTELNKGGTGGGLTSLFFEKIELVNSQFEFERRDLPAAKGRKFNENHILIDQINAEILDMSIIGDSLDFKVKNLSAQEQCGLHIKRLICKASIHYEGMKFSEMILDTDKSYIEREIEFSYDGYPMMADFVDSVDVRFLLENTKIHGEELALFSDDLEPYDHNTIDIEGSAYGKIRDLRFKDMDLNMGNSTQVVLSGKIKGLPYWESSFIDFDIDKLKTSPSDIENYFYLAELPKEVTNLGRSTFKGHLTGFVNDFAADGDLYTELGQLKSRLNFKQAEGADPSFQGELAAINFSLGDFLENDDFGKTSFTFNVDRGSGLNFETLSAQLSSSISYIYFRGNEFQNIDAKGDFNSGKFKGIATIDDSDLKMSFNGSMDLASRLPYYKFTSNVEHLNLESIGLDTIKNVVRASLDIDMKGRNMDDLSGKIGITQFAMHRQSTTYKLDHIFLQSTFSDTSRRVVLRSDFADGEIEGDFKFSQLDLVYEDFLNTLFPDYYAIERPLPKPVVLEAELDIRENDFLSYLIDQDLKLGDGHFKGVYNSEKKSLAIDGRLKRILYDQFTVDDYFINVRKNPYELLNMTTDAKAVYKGDSLFADGVELNASILPNDIDFMFNFSDTNDLLALRSFGYLHFEDDTITLEFEQSKLYSKGRAWTIDDRNKLIFTDGASIVELLQVSSGVETAFVSGKLSNDKTQKLSVWLNHFHLNNLDPVLEEFDIQLGGYSNGTLDIYQVLNRPLIKANLVVDRLTYNGDTLGDFKLISTADEDPFKMNISASIVEGMFKNLNMTGKIDWKNAEQNFDLNVTMRNGSVIPFEWIFEGLASNFSGLIDSDIKLRGTFEEPKIDGDVDFKNVSLFVDYLGTTYTLNNKMYLSEKKIKVDKIKINDSQGNLAKAKGEIRHNLFDDFYLELSIVDAENFLCLNTTKADNDLFYGIAYADGDANFKGPLDDIYVSIKARSEKGTKIFIPVYSDADNSLVDYVRFVNHEEDPFPESRRDIQGVTMDFVFEITEDAEFELLFDELLDDKIYGRGNGNVKMEMNAYGDFYMFGEYVISEGSYPFSSPTLVSEKFDLKEGGVVRWSGDPYNAFIDLEAGIRRYKANPYDLMLGYVAPQEEDNYTGEVVVDVQLFLRGELFSPDITFGIDLPASSTISGNSQFTSLLNRVRSDEDELNRQVFSLVTFGSFSPTTYSNFESEGIGANSEILRTVNSSFSSFLSNQINNWISQYDLALDIGVDYQTQNAAQNRELILSVRKRLFNDRLEFAGSIDAYSNQGRNPYDVNLIYNVKKDGKIRLKAFQKAANDPTLGTLSNITTTGFGIYFRKQFDRIRFKKKKGIAKKD